MENSNFCMYRSNRFEVVRYLVLECSCNPNVMDTVGQTPLHWTSRLAIYSRACGVSKNSKICV